MIGAVLSGRFELSGLLSETPVFALYSAKDRLVGRECSLRLLRPPFDKEDAFKAALVEAVRKSSAVQSPNVERLYEFAVEGDHAFIVGDLTRAPSLADRIRKLAPFTSPVAVHAAIGVARGLDAFHRADVVHGDVSAENVAMLADGETRIQMGAIWEAYAASKTAGSVILPTLAPYMAPEVATGGMPSKRSDVYSVGILLYELLTGRRPYSGESALATAMRHTSEPTPRVRSVNTSVPPVLDEIVYKAMSKLPEQRYANAGELFLDLRQVQDAMRFGRTLTWPLTPSTDSAVSAGRSKAQTEQSRKVGERSAPNRQPTIDNRQPVAPRMSAIRDQPVRGRREEERREADVPIWMWLPLALLVGFGICLLGFYVFLNLDRQRVAAIPNLKGLSVTEAKQELTRDHFTLKVGKAEPSEQYDPDRIIDTDPPAGEKRPEGSVVTATISSGSREVTIPDLKGMTPDKARSVLASENLTLDDQVDHDLDPTVPEGAISRQTPSAGSKVERDQKIHITVNEQTGAQSGASAPSDQMYAYTLSITLTDLKSPGDVKIEVEDDQGIRTIFGPQMEDPGAHLNISTNAHGPQATFRIYYDDVLDSTKTVPANGTAR